MAGHFANGTADIIIDEQELEVKLIFTPQPEGLSWDYDAVTKAVSDKQIKQPPNRDMVEEFLKKAARAKAPMEITLLMGTPPEKVQPEKVKWENLGVPGDVAGHMEDTLQKAGPPIIYKIVVEKVKRETIVKKRGLLPFLPQKEELAVVWDKKETREPVHVDIKVIEKKYAPKGTKLGVIEPAKPGKPGKSVSGKTVLPKQDDDGLFLFGPGIIKNKDEIQAEYAGILRIGANWADIVPLAKPAWNVNKGSDGVTLFLKFEAGDPCFSLPTGKEVLSRALEMGAEETSLVAPDIIDREIKNSVLSGEAIFAYPLFHTQEAEARVIISDDKLKAELFLRKGLAGARPLEMKEISQAIKSSGVRGFNADKVKADIMAFMQGADPVLKDYVLVEGKENTRGKDKEIRVLVEFVSEKEKQEILSLIKKSQHWQVGLNKERFLPLSEVTNIAIVNDGAKVAHVADPQPGEAGKDVFGNVVPALPGNDPYIKLHKGLQLRGTEIFTEKDGILLVHEGKGTFKAQVAEHRDARVLIEISEDRMEASVELVKEAGAGKPLNSSLVISALKDAGVVKGIIMEAVEDACREAAKTGHVSSRVAAKGEHPVAGGGTAVKWLVAFDPPVPAAAAAAAEAAAAEAVAAAEAAKTDGKDEYNANQHHFVSVARGMPLAELKRQGEDGKPGFNVLGEVLSAEHGFSLNFEHDESIKEAPFKGGVRLIALRSGELMFQKNKLKIITTHTVSGDVGEDTGSIRFAGAIHIDGKVRPGYAVICSQDVVIKEDAESSLVAAGGKIRIGKGIVGAGKGIVRARTTIDAAFAQRATLMAVGSIRLRSDCVMCTVKTNGKLVLSGEKGRLVGGMCKSRQGIDAVNIGSEKGSKTEISFGQDYLVKDQIEVAEREIEKIKATLAEIEKKIKQVGSMKAALNEARAEKVKYMKQLEKFGLQVFNLREKFEEHHESEIRVRGTIYPGVVMESHDRYYEVKQQRNSTVFYFDRDSGTIQEKSIT